MNIKKKHTSGVSCQWRAHVACVSKRSARDNTGNSGAATKTISRAQFSSGSYCCFVPIKKRLVTYQYTHILLSFVKTDHEMSSTEFINLPIQVACVCGLSIAGVAGSNSAEGTSFRLMCWLCVV